MATAEQHSIMPIEERIDGAGGLKLFVRSWRPGGRSRAAVMIVPGFNSHSGHYLWVGEQLAREGLATYALDLHGRGRSDGERYFLNSLDDYLSDVGALLRLVTAGEPGLPVFLLGHSAGGVISCVFTLQNQKELAGLICESFAFQVPAPKFALAVIKGLSYLAPHVPVLRLPNKEFSRDPNVVAALDADSLIADEVQPTKTVAELVRADERLKWEFPLIKLPVLILHGDDDKVTKPAGSRFFYEKAGSSDKTLKIYEGHYHDLLNDIGKEVVIDDIKAWISDRIVTVAAV